MDSTENTYGWESDYKDKFGRPIGADELELLLRNKEYTVIKQETVGDVFISTAWLGVAFDMGQSFFETLVCEADKNSDCGFDCNKLLDCERYDDISQAEVGHAKMVKKWRKKNEN
jgi:hypothetical protein